MQPFFLPKYRFTSLYWIHCQMEVQWSHAMGTWWPKFVKFVEMGTLVSRMGTQKSHVFKICRNKPIRLNKGGEMVGIKQGNRSSRKHPKTWISAAVFMYEQYSKPCYAMPHHDIQRNAIQPMQCNPLPYHATSWPPCHATPYHAIPCNAMTHHAMQWHTMQYNAIHCYATPCNTIP